jgi:hypothetical protein
VTASHRSGIQVWAVLLASISGAVHNLKRSAKNNGAPLLV